ncbi:uncharacterized protein LOC106465499 [Limulus polyphemus]|uniref:Uncharacterized protein LOC106465499 n=1 Tax=Limulus polyphemus TaxID=6850 RepID=A0ABM1BFV6_LIMPO|nr:uncharacterized protein LOC106465499 [Limulus polyphemus]
MKTETEETMRELRESGKKLAEWVQQISAGLDEVGTSGGSASDGSSEPECGEERKFASRAVAFVIKNSRKGIVPLCVSVAALLQEKENLKKQVRDLKKKVQGLQGSRSNPAGLFSSSSLTTAEPEKQSSQSIQASEHRGKSPQHYHTLPSRGSRKLQNCHDYHKEESIYGTSSRVGQKNPEKTCDDGICFVEFHYSSPEHDSKNSENHLKMHLDEPVTESKESSIPKCCTERLKISDSLANGSDFQTSNVPEHLESKSTKKFPQLLSKDLSVKHAHCEGLVILPESELNKVLDVIKEMRQTIHSPWHQKESKQMQVI